MWTSKPDAGIGRGEQYDDSSYEEGDDDTEIPAPK